jgi:hypothetical protein
VALAMGSGQGRARPIVALGGRELSAEPEQRLLDDDIPGLTGEAQPRVCSLPAAGGHAVASVLRFYQASADARTALGSVPPAPASPAAAGAARLLAEGAQRGRATGRPGIP